MTLFLDDGDVRLYHGDALTVLRDLPPESVHMCVTSPPFYGLRDYGTGRWEGGNPDCDHGVEYQRSRVEARTPYFDGGAPRGTPRDPLSVVCKCGARRVDQQIGLEETPEQWVASLVAVFREVKRVLRPEGTLWLEVGDSYAASGPRATGRNDSDRETPGGRGGSFRGGERLEIASTTPGYKPKDLIGAPWQLAFALRADGWYLALRHRLVKTKSHAGERHRPAHQIPQLHLSTEQAPRYFFDQEAVREPHDSRPQQRLTANVDMPLGAARVAAGVQQGNPQGGVHVSRFQVQNEGLLCGCIEAGCGRTFAVDDCGCACHPDELDKWDEEEKKMSHWSPGVWDEPTGRNVRSVWSIATQPYPEAHFATFPEELARRCILAGTSGRGCCPECGAPWVREVETTEEYALWLSQRTGDLDPGRRRKLLAAADRDLPARGTNSVPPPAKNRTLGWRPSCDCACETDAALAPVSPCVVLDPFVGSGTVPLCGAETRPPRHRHRPLPVLPRAGSAQAAAAQPVRMNYERQAKELERRVCRDMGLTRRGQVAAGGWAKGSDNDDTGPCRVEIKYTTRYQLPKRMGRTGTGQRRERRPAVGARDPGRTPRRAGRQTLAVMDYATFLILYRAAFAPLGAGRPAFGTPAETNDRSSW